MALTDSTLCAIECAIRELLEQGYGDPLDSLTGSTVLGTAYTSVVRAPRTSLLIVENIAAVDVFWTILDKSLKDSSVVGKKLAASIGKLTLDRFRGTFYAKGSAGATIDYALLVWNKPAEYV